MSDLHEELREAEAALMASFEATRTHGHQGMTWRLLAYDRQRVEELRAALAAFPSPERAECVP